MFEVAAILRVHYQTVRTWIRRGELGQIRIGHRVYVSVDQLRAFIDERTIEATKYPNRRDPDD